MVYRTRYLSTEPKFSAFFHASSCIKAGSLINLGWSDFSQFSKLDTLLPIRYAFMSSFQNTGKIGQAHARVTRAAKF